MSTAESVRAEAYQSIGSVALPDIIDPEDVPTLVADLEHVIGLLANYRYRRDQKVVRRMMFEIAHLAMFGMRKFGTGESSDKEHDWARVIIAVDEERDHQDKLSHERCGNTIDNNPLSIGASFVVLEQYVADSRKNWIVETRNEDALYCVRKIAAIAIRDLETNGLPAYTDHAREDPKE